MTARGRSTLFGAVLIGALAVGAYAAFIESTAFLVDGDTWYSLFDDAMISMRYARNLAEGQGLVWNPGEPAVEGYTNLLWTLVMSGVHLLPVTEARTSLVVMIVAAAMLLANAAVVGALALRLTDGSRAAALAVAGAVALYYPTIFWTLRGMEVGLVTLLVGWGSLAALRFRKSGSGRDSAAAGVALGLAILTRIDAILPAGILFLFLRFGAKASRRAIAPYVVIALGTLALHTAFRLAYYGDPLPNTYYLKVTGIGLAPRIGRGIWALGELVRLHLWSLLVVVGIVTVVLRRTMVRAPVVLLASLFAGQCLYSVAVGGDAWEWMDYSNRFVATGVPFLIPVVAFGARELGRRHGGALSHVLPVLVLAVLVVLLDAGPVRLWRAGGPLHAPDDARMTRIGLAVHAATEPTATIAVVWAGAVPYFARRRCVDLLGKNDPVVARRPGRGPFNPGHNKSSYRHSIGTLRPDVILQASFIWTEPGFWPFVTAQGYERFENGVFVRADSRLVDREALRQLEDPDH